jgi:molybdopterin synthase catalytic subunit
VSTGSTTSTVRLAEIREQPLDLGEVTNAVSEAAAGGVAVFLGTVREEDHGRRVTGLDYTAHPSAVDRLREVAEQICAEYGVLALAAVHRVGTLEIGDAAVIVAASAPHRGLAFDACRACIDLLKSTVPIWKHQRFADGSDEWVGTP